MVIITINAGSSSLKWAGFRNNKKISYELIDFKTNKINSHKKAIQHLKKKIPKDAIILHRTVHGGIKSCNINKQKIKEFKEYIPLAPLHLPYQIEYMKAFPKHKQIAVFDSCYYSNLNKNETTLPLPKKFSKDKRYKIMGFHGIAHYAVTRGEKGNIITCHLGSGCSITATKNGRALANSMEQTPLSGVAMRTRPGSIDPGLLLELAIKESPKKLLNTLYFESGLSSFIKGGDMRDLLNKKKYDVIDFFSYGVAKQVSSYIPLLQKIDTIIFSGGIGENEWHVRKRICNYLSFLNIKLDNKKNKQNKELISTRASKVKVKIKSANEEETMLKLAKKDKLL